MIDRGIVKAARQAIQSYFSRKDFSLTRYPEKKGVFVTLYEDGELRGCVGFIESVELNKGLIDAARSAAFSDPRFPPLQEDELKDIRIEISLLSKPELLEGNYLKQIKIGRDGLIVEGNFTSGLLLPQVFVEYNTNEEEALEMTCEKANLSRNAWKEKGIKVYKFKCEVYSEEKPNGNVKKLM